MKNIKIYVALFTIMGAAFIVGCEEYVTPTSSETSFEALATAEAITIGETVTFTDNSTGVDSRSWTFSGDPASSSNRTVTVKYNSAGTFTESLNVNFKNGSTESKEFTVTVSAETTSVSADFSADETSIGEGEKVTFTSNVGGEADTYEWTFEGGTPATASIRNPTITYESFGDYDVTLKVTRNSDSGTDTEVKTDFITVNQEAVEASFTFDRNEIFQGQAVQFTNTSKNSPDGFSWTFEGESETLTSTEENPLVTFNETGVYDVTLVATRSHDGGSDTETMTDAITVTKVVSNVLELAGSDWDFNSGDGWTVVQGVDEANVTFVTATGGAESVMKVNLPTGDTGIDGVISSNKIASIAVGDYTVKMRFRNPPGGGSEADGGALEIRCYVQDHAVFTPGPGGTSEDAQQIVGVFKLGGISTTNLTTWTTSEFTNSDEEGDFADTDEWVELSWKWSPTQELVDRAFKFHVRIGAAHAASEDAAFEIDYIEIEPVN